MVPRNTAATAVRKKTRYVTRKTFPRWHKKGMYNSGKEGGAPATRATPDRSHYMEAAGEQGEENKWDGERKKRDHPIYNARSIYFPVPSHL